MSNSQAPLGSGFDRFSEPDAILDGIELGGKVAIVTGGYSGLGIETVRALHKAGAHIVIPGRTAARIDTALREAKLGPAIDGNGITIAQMDLGDQHSITAFAEDFLSHFARLDLLINNAGIMSCPETRIGPGWEQQFGVNHLGHFALASRLMPHLVETAGKSDGDVRVIALSSTGHKLSDIRWDDPHWHDGSYEKWTAYGQSKTANALFAVGLNARLQPYGARAFSVHPGGISTPLQRHLDIEEMVAMGWMKPDGTLSEFAAANFKTPAQGAGTSLWAATSALLKDKGGQYCENCDFAQLDDLQNPTRYMHVAPYAVDPEGADKLWQMSKVMLAEA